VLERLLSDYDLEALGIKSRSALQKDRVAGRGIPFIKIGRLVRYRPDDVKKYIFDLPTLRSTSEADAHVAQAGIERPAIAKAAPASGPVGAGRGSKKRSTPPSAPQRESRAMRAVPERVHPRHRRRDDVATAAREGSPHGPPSSGLGGRAPYLSRDRFSERLSDDKE
jgi:hypothetical protein